MDEANVIREYNRLSGSLDNYGYVVELDSKCFFVYHKSNPSDIFFYFNSIESLQGFYIGVKTERNL
jgi:hypothetical protein